MTRVAIDPVTRIEGHLRLEVESSNGRVTDAWSTGTMFVGIEKILIGRNPKDAWMFAQRACGVCTHVHAQTSVRAVEAALGIRVPANARLLRNVMSATQVVHDHVVHFYHLHLPDWVDVTATLKADPATTAALAAATNRGWTNNSAAWFTTVQERLSAFVSSGQLGPFTNGYWGHPAFTCTPEESLLLYSHYLEALDFQREIVKIHAYLGGKNPHPQTYVVGGMSTLFGPNVATGVNTATLAAMRRIARSARRFVDRVLVPDMTLLAKRYRDEWFDVGGGLGNLLSYGDYDRVDGGDQLFPAGRIVGRDLGSVHPVDVGKVGETVARSWYSYSGGDDALLHPYQGQTNPLYSGPKPPYDMIGDIGSYSWLKAPRYDGGAYEVGPLAHMLIGYATGRVDFRTSVDMFTTDVGVPVTKMFSTMGRLAARTLETQLMAPWVDTWLAQLEAQLRKGDLTTVTPLKPRSTWGDRQGYGVTEAPRGALGHWVSIEDGTIANYQMVVPTTWNGSPRDASGQRGAWEQALVDTPLHDGAQPLEVLRTVHSFDPCMGCAVHVLDPEGRPLTVVDVVP